MAKKKETGIYDMSRMPPKDMPKGMHMMPGQKMPMANEAMKPPKKKGKK